MKIKIIILLLILLSNVYAVDSKHFLAAKKLVDVNFNINTPHEMAETITNGLLMQTPQNRPFKDVYIAFFEKMYSSQELHNEIARIYMHNYSLEELQYATKIFSDPKMIAYMKKSPKIMQESIMSGQKIAKKHLDELQSAIKEKANELQKVSSKF